MTPEFLESLIKKFPNNYELGKIIRKFYFFHKEKEQSINLFRIQDEFITHINNES